VTTFNPNGKRTMVMMKADIDANPNLPPLKRPIGWGDLECIGLDHSGVLNVKMVTGRWATWPRGRETVWRGEGMRTRRPYHSRQVGTV
jgi:hypothetical protein